MTVEEWLKQKLSPRFSDERHIENILFVGEVDLDTKTKRILNRYILIGKLRQMLVANAVRMQVLKCRKFRQVWERCNIKMEVEHNMHAEPYAVFYKSHILKTPTRFSRIADRVEEIK